MPAKKKDEGNAVVRPTFTDAGEVKLVHGTVVNGVDEVEFTEGQSWVISTDAAAELLDALPNALQEARHVQAAAAQA